MLRIRFAQPCSSSGVAQDKTGKETAYLFKKLTKVQRDALIERKVAFVSVPDQIYLPFLGVMMRNNFRKESDVNTDKMMPATQSLFLYILYHGNGSYILKKQAAEDLSLTRTSITRASRQLKEMGLIAEERHGKEIRMTSLADGRELFEPQFLLGSPRRRSAWTGRMYLPCLTRMCPTSCASGTRS